MRYKSGRRERLYHVLERKDNTFFGMRLFINADLTSSERHRGDISSPLPSLYEFSIKSLSSLLESSSHSSSEGSEKRQHTCNSTPAIGILLLTYTSWLGSSPVGQESLSSWALLRSMQTNSIIHSSKYYTTFLKIVLFFKNIYIYSGSKHAYMRGSSYRSTSFSCINCAALKEKV